MNNPGLSSLVPLANLTTVGSWLTIEGLDLLASLDGLQGFDWSEYLDRQVAVVNDAHAALLGEIWQGSARGLSDVILLTLGTGVGGAVVTGGKLLRGHLGRSRMPRMSALAPPGLFPFLKLPGKRS